MIYIFFKLHTLKKLSKPQLLLHKLLERTNTANKTNQKLSFEIAGAAADQEGITEDTDAAQEDHEAHLQDGGPAGQAQPDGDQGAPGGVGAAGRGEYLGEDDVVGQEHRDHHGPSQQQVGPQRLRPLSHELLVIETEQQQAGEEGEEAAVEDLGHEDDEGPVSWKINFEK